MIQFDICLWFPFRGKSELSQAQKAKEQEHECDKKLNATEMQESI